jgi:hypothetical protein
MPSRSNAFTLSYADFNESSLMEPENATSAVLPDKATAKSHCSPGEGISRLSEQSPMHRADAQHQVTPGVRMVELVHKLASSESQEAPPVPPPLERNDHTEWGEPGTHRLRRFTFFAACLLLASGLGVLVGAGAPAGRPLTDFFSQDTLKATREITRSIANSLTSLLPKWPSTLNSAASPHNEAQETKKTLNDEIADLRNTIKALETRLKAYSSSRGKQIAEANAALAMIQESVTKVGEEVSRKMRSQSDLEAKINEMSEIVRRGERQKLLRVTGTQLSGSNKQITATAHSGLIPSPRRPVVAHNESAGVKQPVEEGYVVRTVADGVAFIQDRSGIIEVEVGDSVPGLGAVKQITQKDGRWSVVTSRGTILSR